MPKKQMLIFFIEEQRERKEMLEWTIKRHWQHLGIEETRRRKTKHKTQHNICWTPLYARKHK